MFEASSVYFQCVNEQAAHVFPVGVDLSDSKSLISLVIGSYQGSMNENQKTLGV